MTTPKKPISEARLQANRNNAKKSTGPRTPEGKARSARNATTHGLTAAFHSNSVIPIDLTVLGENIELLNHTIAEFTRSWNPATPYEASLIKRLAEIEIRLDRCVRMETGLLDMEMPPVTNDDTRPTINSAHAQAFITHETSFMNYSRYEANLSRAYDRALKQLLAVRKQDLSPLDPRDGGPFLRPTLVPSRPYFPDHAPDPDHAPNPDSTALHDETNPLCIENKELLSAAEPASNPSAQPAPCLTPQPASSPTPEPATSFTPQPTQSPATPPLPQPAPRAATASVSQHQIFPPLRPYCSPNAMPIEGKKKRQGNF